MTALQSIKHTRLSSTRLPWRYQQQQGDGPFEVWTKEDKTPGSQNNYVVAGEIQSRDEARLLAAAPDLLEALLQYVEDDTDPHKRERAAYKTVANAVFKATNIDL